MKPWGKPLDWKIGFFVVIGFSNSIMRFFLVIVDTRNVSQWVSNLSLSSTKRTERSTLTPKRRGEGLMTYLKSRLMLIMIAAIPTLTTTMTDPEARRAPWAWSCNRFSPITPWPQWKKLWIRMWPECSSQVPDLPGFRATRK